MQNNTYTKYKGKEVDSNGFRGILCGFTEDRFILCGEEVPSYAFRRLDRGTFIEEEYKDAKFRYWYCNEGLLDKQLGKSITELTKS